MKMRRLLFALCLFPIVVFAGSRPPQPEVRAIWVTRFDYKTPQDVSSIVINCAKAGFTDIFFQVRGNATTYYPSQVEPWAFELTGKDVSTLGVDPGWDPLQMAVSWAKRYGIRLHAWMNVLPAWRGFAEPPASAGQLWTARPDWFMVDSTGARMRPTSAWYSFVNPAHPQVQAHLVSVAKELARYDVAGLHLDYIRFPYDYRDVAREIYRDASQEQIQAHSIFSFDPVSMAATKRSTSRAVWDRFRRDAVSKVVLDLQDVFEERITSSSIVSASVLADFNLGYSQAFQDSRRWAKKGMVDWLVPMNYNARLFDQRMSLARKALGRRILGDRVVMGINCALSEEEIMRQIQASQKAGCRGFSLFAYTYLFENHQPTKKARVLQRGL